MAMTEMCTFYAQRAKFGQCLVSTTATECNERSAHRHTPR